MALGPQSADVRKWRHWKYELCSWLFSILINWQNNDKKQACEILLWQHLSWSYLLSLSSYQNITLSPRKLKKCYLHQSASTTIRVQHIYQSADSKYLADLRAQADASTVHTSLHSNHHASEYHRLFKSSLLGIRGCSRDILFYSCTVWIIYCMMIISARRHGTKLPVKC